MEGGKEGGGVGERKKERKPGRGETNVGGITADNKIAECRGKKKQEESFLTLLTQPPPPPPPTKERQRERGRERETLN